MLAVRLEHLAAGEDGASDRPSDRETRTRRSATCLMSIDVYWRDSGVG